MPAMERTFRIPTGQEDLDIKIHEPSLTGDNLGLKTWAASYLLAKRLWTIPLPSLYDSRSSISGRYDVLELGSGTGLVGMAAAAVLKTGVVLTDLPEIESNLARNVDENRATIQHSGGSVTTAILDWSKPSIITPSSPLRSLTTTSAATAKPRSFEIALPTPPDSTPSTPSQLPTCFPVIVAADCIYDPVHASLLADTITIWLSRQSDARVVIELPLRAAYLTDVEELKRRMASIGLDLLEQGEEDGVDDWGSNEGEDQAIVRCWWGVWARAAQSAHNN